MSRARCRRASRRCSPAAGLVEGDDYETVLLDGFDPLAHYALDDIVGFPGYKSNEPGQLERAGLPFELFDPTAFDVPGSFGVIFTSRDFAEQHPTATEDFLRATMRGLADAVADPDAAAQTAIDLVEANGNPSFLSLEGESFRWRTDAELLAAETPDGTGMGVPDAELLQAEVDAYAEVGLFGGEAPDVEAFIHGAPIEAVYDESARDLARLISSGLGSQASCSPHLPSSPPPLRSGAHPPDLVRLLSDTAECSRIACSSSLCVAPRSVRIRLAVPSSTRLEREQDVLAADVVVTQPQRLAQRQLQRLLRPLGEWDVPSRRAIAVRHTLVDHAHHRLPVDAHRAEHDRRHVAPGAGEEPEQDVLGLDGRVVASASLVLRGGDRTLRPRREALEQTVGESLPEPARQPTVALLRGLARDAERLTDLRPRAAVGPRSLDEVVEQLVGQLLDLLAQRRRRLDPLQRVVARLLDVGDHLLQVHMSTLR